MTSIQHPLFGAIPAEPATPVSPTASAQGRGAEFLSVFQEASSESAADQRVASEQLRQARPPKLRIFSSDTGPQSFNGSTALTDLPIADELHPTSRPAPAEFRPVSLQSPYLSRQLPGISQELSGSQRPSDGPLPAAPTDTQPQAPGRLDGTFLRASQPLTDRPIYFERPPQPPARPTVSPVSVAPEVIAPTSLDQSGSTLAEPATTIPANSAPQPRDLSAEVAPTGVDLERYRLPDPSTELPVERYPAEPAIAEAPVRQGVTSQPAQSLGDAPEIQPSIYRTLADTNGEGPTARPNAYFSADPIRVAAYSNRADGLSNFQTTPPQRDAADIDSSSASARPDLPDRPAAPNSLISTPDDAISAAVTDPVIEIVTPESAADLPAITDEPQTAVPSQAASSVVEGEPIKAEIVETVLQSGETAPDLQLAPNSSETVVRTSPATDADTIVAPISSAESADPIFRPDPAIAGEQVPPVTQTDVETGTAAPAKNSETPKPLPTATINPAQTVTSTEAATVDPTVIAEPLTADTDIVSGEGVPRAEPSRAEQSVSISPVAQTASNAPEIAQTGIAQDTQPAALSQGLADQAAPSTDSGPTTTAPPLVAATSSSAPTAPAAPLTPVQTAPGTVPIVAPQEIVNIVNERLNTGNADDRQIVVQLDPPELGRVSIDFKFDAIGLQSVIVTGESPEAVKQLRTLHYELVNALEQQGLSSDDLVYQQSTPDRQPNQQSFAGQSFNQYPSLEEGEQNAIAEPTIRASTPNLSGQDGLDIKV